MRSLRVLAPLALGATLLGVAIAPQAASRSVAEPVVVDPAPMAHAAGGDAGPLVYPSIVNVRLVRAEAALERAATAVDQGQQSQAIAEIVSAGSNTTTAWSAAQYVISKTPPPTVDAPPSGFASPEETALAVINLQHDVVTTATGLIDVAGAPLESTLNVTISATIAARRAAIAYIHSIPPPPVAGEDRVHAAASGAPIAAGWAMLMPGIVPLVNDELQQSRGTSVTGAKWRFLLSMRHQMVATAATINLYWPPVVGDD